MISILHFQTTIMLHSHLLGGSASTKWMVTTVLHCHSLGGDIYKSNMACVQTLSVCEYILVMCCCSISLMCAVSVIATKMETAVRLFCPAVTAASWVLYAFSIHCLPMNGIMLLPHKQAICVGASLL